MFSRILSVIPDGNRKFPLRYQRMVNSILDRMVLAKNRYLLAHPIQTSGVELLRFLCLNLNISVLDEYQTDEDRYTEVIKFYKDQYRSAIDPVFSNTIAGGKWIPPWRGITPYEIYLSCELDNPLRDLPFGKDWSEWKHLRAVKLLYHDSLELPEDFAQSKFKFYEQMPLGFVFSINVPVLMFKYYKYVQACRDHHLDVDTNAFLKDNELTYFFDDLFDIWILNLLTTVLSNPKSSTDQIVSELTVPIRFCTTNMLRQGVDGIKEFVDLLMTGSIKPQDFLATKWFRDNRTLLDVMNEIERTVALPETHKYLWLDCIKWFPYLYLVLVIVRRFPDGPLKDTINNRCIEIWNTKFRTANMPSTVLAPTNRNVVTTMQQVLEALLVNNKPIVFPFFRRPSSAKSPIPPSQAETT